jgi:hypothetical protein
MPWLPEVHRFPSVGTPIGRALGVEPPECRVQNGRTTLTFRRLGATRWSEAQQMEFARRAVAVARSVLADDDRGQLRRGARRAIVIVLEDATVVQDCAVVARWECTVPSPPDQ